MTIHKNSGGSTEFCVKEKVIAKWTPEINLGNLVALGAILVTVMIFAIKDRDAFRDTMALQSNRITALTEQIKALEWQINDINYKFHEYKIY